MLKTYEDFVNEAKEYNNILLKYKNTGEVYSDPNFHPQAEIKEYRYSFNKYYAWKRIDEYYKAPLFKPDSIDSNFIKQGELGDCYFLSALSRLARQPDLVQSLFDDQANMILGEEKDSINIKCGAVVIYFHAFGRETPVLIDTLIPFKRGTRTPRFSHPTDLNVSPWFCLVEKAYAKLNGSYTAIDGGTLPGAIYSLFGYFPDVKWVNQLKQPRKVRKMTPFNRLMKYQHKGSVMGAAIHLQYLTKGITEEDLLDLGLITGHSYVIMKVRNHDDKNFICLRNPWGGHEWLGDWSDTSDKWTNELKEALGMQESEDGSFWMSDADFFNYFNKIDISRPIPPEFHSKIVHMQMTPGPHDGRQVSSIEANVGNRTNYAIEITEPIRKGERCKLYIIIERRRQTIDPKTKQYIEPAQFTAVILNTGGKKITPDIYNHTSDAQVITTPQDLLGINQLVRANRHIYTIFVQRIQKSPYTDDCYIQVYCKYEFKLYDIDNPTEVIPDAQSGGIVFDNYSICHPDIAPKLLKKKVGRKVVTSIDTDDKEDEAPIVSKDESFDHDEEEEEMHVTKEELDKAKAKAEEEAKAKEKAEEEAKAALEEVNRLKAKMKQMEDEIAEREKKLKEESDKAKQDELEKELELEKSLYETSKIDFKVKKKNANNLRQKAQQKKNEHEDADKYASYLLDSYEPDKKKPKLKLKAPEPAKKIEVVIPEEKIILPKIDDTKKSSDSDDESGPTKDSGKLSTSSSDDDTKPTKSSKKLSASSSDDDDDKPARASSLPGSTDDEKTDKKDTVKRPKSEKPAPKADAPKPKRRSIGVRRFIPKTMPV